MKKIATILFATLIGTTMVSAQAFYSDPIGISEIAGDEYTEEIIDASFPTEFLEEIVLLSDDDRAAKIDMFLIQNRKYFPKSKIDNIREILMNLDDTRLKSVLMFAEDELKNPTTVLVVSIVVPILTGGLISGVDRMMIGQTGLGILKLLTYGGLWIWNIIDWFNIKDLTKKYNYNQLLEMCGVKY